MIGLPEGELVSGALRSARIHRLSHTLLSAAEIRWRFPVFQPDDEMQAVWEPRAGALFLEPCIESHLKLARDHGASLHFEEPVSAWEATPTGVRVITPQGAYQAERLLLASGAWLDRLVPDLRLPLTVTRQVLLWFEPVAQRDGFQPDRCPIYIWENAPGRHFYGFPDLGNGIKAAISREGETTDPDAMRREVGTEEIEALRALLGRFMPGANGALRNTAVCLYTNSPDRHFLIDFHPLYPQVLIASPCSGHGFKFSSAIGELLADLITVGQTSHDIGLFRLERLTGQTRRS
jgi:sarcosine oxidase